MVSTVIIALPYRLFTYSLCIVNTVNACNIYIRNEHRMLRKHMWLLLTFSVFEYEHMMCMAIGIEIK